MEIVMNPPTPGDRARRTGTVAPCDAERRSRFDGVVVRGGVTTGLLNAMVAEDLPARGGVLLHVDWSFKAPVRPGDEITAAVEMLEARADKPISRLRTTITRQDGVIALEGIALVWRESPAV